MTVYFLFATRNVEFHEAQCVDMDPAKADASNTWGWADHISQWSFCVHSFIIASDRRGHENCADSVG